MELEKGMEIMLRAADMGGYIAAQDPAEVAACKKLKKAGLVTHVRRSIFKLTDEGRVERDAL
jgi:Mn-dependent DtxR family transcriptional regulator